MPVVPFLYGLIFRLFGEVRLYIQIFTTLLFSGAVVLTYAIGKKLWDENTGLAAGMLLLGIPYLYSQVPLMLVDVPSMFLLTLTIFVFMKAIESGGMMVPVSGVLIFLTFFAKYSTWLMLSVLAVISLVYACAPSGNSDGDAPAKRKSGEMRRLFFLRGMLAGIFSVLLIGILFFWKREVFTGQMALLLDYQGPGLRRWGESFVSTFFFQVHPLVTLAALFSGYRALRKRDLGYFISVCLLIFVVFLQIRRIRYIVMGFPMLSLAASYGLQQIQKRDVVKFLAAGAAISSFIVAVAVYLPFLDRISMVNLSHAAALLDKVEGNSVDVVTLTPPHPVANIAASVPILDLFTGKQISYSYDRIIPADAEDIVTSPLRFTWEYRNPPYYAGALRKPSALAVIAGEENPAIPPEIAAKIKKFKRAKSFNASTGVFSYKTFMTVYY